jgi:hypothetical protein
VSVTLTICKFAIENMSVPFTSQKLKSSKSKPVSFMAYRIAKWDWNTQQEKKIIIIKNI